MSSPGPPATDSMDWESPAAHLFLPVQGTAGPQQEVTANPWSSSNDPLASVFTAPPPGRPGGGSARETLDDLLASWPELAALRRAASAVRTRRFPLEIGSVIGSARISFAAALLGLTRPPTEAITLTLATARARYHVLRSILLLHLPELARA